MLRVYGGPMSTQRGVPLMLLLLLACGPRRGDTTATPEPTPTTTPQPAEDAAARTPANTDTVPATDGVAAAQLPPPSHEVLERAKGHFMRGIAALERREYDAALVEFEASQLLVPRAHTRLNIARCREHLGDLDGARAELIALSSDKDLDEEVRASTMELLEAVERKMGRPDANPPK
ncbi:MAG: hypothetical protein K1X88_24945 [Nannocystaceae bacterium]|nr:hypothetical protein [Nannocystaceae bacterium]